MLKKSLFPIQQPARALNIITMAAAKDGLTFEKSGAFKNAGDVNWCKHIAASPTHEPMVRSIKPGEML